MHSLFISDLHLCESRPHITQAFISFLSHTASQAESLYILGDLFEYWAGDDAIAIGVHASIISAMRKLTETGTALFVMHGNRDFLLGSTFETSTGGTLLDDPTLLPLYGKQVLVSHGDALCTDDVSYQEFRTHVRSPNFRQSFLSQSLEERVAFIESMRKKSEQEKRHKSMEIMDVNPDAVAALLKTYDFPTLLIHGHTHRPAIHLHQLEGHTCERLVLGDWYDHGTYLALDANGYSTHHI